MKTTTGRGVLAAVAIAAAAGLVAAPAASAAVDTVDAKASKGTMTWGVKESFRNYIESPIADGAIEVTAPAVRNADGTFTWKKGRGQVDVAADTADIKLKGEVYFYGHDDGTGPQLEIYVDKPRIVIDGDDSVLVADVTSRGFSGGGLVTYDDVELVTIDASGLDLKANGKGIVKVKNLPTAITADGAEAFAGFYGEGTAFDALSFKIKLA